MVAVIEDHEAAVRAVAIGERDTTAEDGAHGAAERRADLEAGAAGAFATGGARLGAAGDGEEQAPARGLEAATGGRGIGRRAAVHRDVLAVGTGAREGAIERLRAAHVVLGREACGVDRGALAGEGDAVTREALERTREISAPLAQGLLGLHVARERTARALDAHGVRHEGVEAAAEREHSRTGKLVERLAANEHAGVGVGDLSPQLPELQLVRGLLCVEIGDLAIERRQREGR